MHKQLNVELDERLITKSCEEELYVCYIINVHHKEKSLFITRTFLLGALLETPKIDKGVNARLSGLEVCQC